MPENFEIYEALLADDPSTTATPSTASEGPTLPTTDVDRAFATPSVPTTATLPTVQPGASVAKPTDATSFDYMKVVSPIVSGLVMTALVYGVARSAAVEKPKAVKTAIVIGGFTLLGQVLGNWLQSKVDELKRQQAVPQASI